MAANSRDTNPWPVDDGPKRGYQASVIHPFHVGGLYANRQGEYEVLEIAPPKMTVRYHNGGLLVADIAILARIWENLQAPAPIPEPRARVAATRAPARPRAPRAPRKPPASSE